MVRNYKAVIVRGLPVEKPVALCGGIGHNQGVIQAVREVFGLTEAELIQIIRNGFAYSISGQHLLPQFDAWVERFQQEGAQ